MIEAQHVYTVSELNRSARDLLEARFGELWVKGEISDLKRAASGHLYFTLKDEEGELSAVRFRSRSPLLADTTVESGTVVLAFGKLTIYEPRGRYQFVATLIQPVSTGALRLAFERLKEKLQKEGLFAPEHKLPIPAFPERIGVITSSSGAALRDVVSILERRWPSVAVVLFPSSVQGDAAPAELRDAVDRAVRFSRDVAPLDTLIIGRGGGSAEDLAAFNDEALARAIFDCPIPIVSAVGHEVDFSIADFVADLRAPTPSAAAELAVPNRAEVGARLEAAASRTTRAVGSALRGRRSSLRSLLRGYLFRLPQRRLETLEQRLDLQLGAAVRGITAVWTARRRAASHVEEVLRLSNPELPLQRGYSLTFAAGSSRPLRDASGVSEGDEIETRLAAGRLTSRVEEVNAE
jgi:exodeoxyribonuclease VII large subunit